MRLTCAAAITALLTLPLLPMPAAAQLAPDTKTTATVRMKQCRAVMRSAKPAEDVFNKSGACVRECAGHTIYGNAHTWDMCSLSHKRFQVAAGLAAGHVPQKTGPTRGPVKAQP